MGGFLLVTVASVFVGMTISTIRWATIDAVHSRTGIRQPRWNLRNLKDRAQAFEVLNQIHYRHYQFLANSMVAIVTFQIGRWSSRGFAFGEFVASVALIILFFFGSRDTLRKYFERVDDLLAS